MHHDRYKVFISVMFGLLGFIGSLYSIQFHYSDVKIIICWSLIFPLMVVMAWGRRYGCISIILGLTVLYPFYTGRYNGWACLVPAFSLLIWIMILGYGAEKRLQVRRFYTNIYFLQFIYIMFHVILYFTAFPFLYRFNPPFWYPNAHTTIEYSTIAVFAFKSIIVEFILLASCDVLLLLPFVRKIFRLECSKASRYNTGIVLCVTTLGMFFTFIIMINNYYIIDGNHSLQWLLHPSAKALMTLFLAGIFSIIFGGVLSRIFEWQLETKETLKMSEAKYQSIYENINDLYTEAAIDGTILTISPSVREILGYENYELIGTNICKLHVNPMKRLEIIKTLLREKEIKNYEIIIKNKEGNHRYLWLNAKLTDYGDRQQKIIGVARDVTQYMEAMTKQKESEKNYKLLYDRMLNSFFAIEPVFDVNQKLYDIRFVDANPAFEKHASKKAVELLGKTWSEAYGFRNRYLEVYEKVFLTGLPQSFEAYNPDLKHQYYLVNAFMINQNRVGVIFDSITERVKAEQELKLREEKYRNIFENIHDLYFETQMDGTILVVSPSTKSILGYEPEEVVNRSAALLCADYRFSEKIMEKIIADGSVENIEVEVLTKDGEKKTFWYNAHAITDISGNQKIIGMSRDVTDYLAAKRMQEESEAKYKLLFDKMMNGLLVLEPIYNNKNEVADAHLVDVNPGFERLTGLNADDILGKKWSEIFANKNGYLNNCQRVFQTGEYLQFENYDLFLNQYFRSGIFKINDNRIGAVFENITERKKAEEELKRANTNLEAIVENTNDLIWLADRDFKIIFCNSAFSNHIGKYYRADTILGTHPEDIFTNDYSLAWTSYYEQTLKEGCFSMELLSPGNGRYFDMSFNPIYKEGEVLAISCFAKDITERKLAQQEILKLNTELEQRVEERTAELQVAISELEAFTYTVSHDLKSPLRAIDAYSRIMLEDYPEQMKGEIGEIADNIKNISRDMIELINKLLQYSIMARLNVFKEIVEIDKLIYMIFQELVSAIPERQIKLIMETKLPQVRADRILLKQVIYNFISNAIKFTKTCDIAIIKVGHVIDKEEIVFYINDNGIGFDMKSSSKLFGIFQRIHSTDEYEGTGIGLAIVRKIVQKHGGRTWIEGKPDQGATVYFTLPMIEG